MNSRKIYKLNMKKWKGLENLAHIIEKTREAIAAEYDKKDCWFVSVAAGIVGAFMLWGILPSVSSLQEERFSLPSILTAVAVIMLLVGIHAIVYRLVSCVRPDYYMIYILPFELHIIAEKLRTEHSFSVEDFGKENQVRKLGFKEKLKMLF